MAWEIILLLLANVYFLLAWIWALVTMSSYIRPGKGILLITPFWIFSDSWFFDEGIPYLKKARIHTITPVIVMISVWILMCK